jgi:SAM-dependent methyltransferase
MFQKILTWFIQLTPGVKRGFWKWWYNAFAKRARDDTFKFMNYGYHAPGFNPPLDKSDENERYPIHLYHRVATQIDIADKTVLEVGSGRGGGASYLTRYLNPKSYVGIDISETTGFPDGECRCKDPQPFQKYRSQHKTLDLNISSGMTRHRPARSQLLKQFYRLYLFE